MFIEMFSHFLHYCGMIFLRQKNYVSFQIKWWPKCKGQTSDSYTWPVDSCSYWLMQQLASCSPNVDFLTEGFFLQDSHLLMRNTASTASPMQCLVNHPQWLMATPGKVFSCCMQPHVLVLLQDSCLPTNVDCNITTYFKVCELSKCIGWMYNEVW